MYLAQQNAIWYFSKNASSLCNQKYLLEKKLRMLTGNWESFQMAARHFNLMRLSKVSQTFDGEKNRNFFVNFIAM